MHTAIHAEWRLLYNPLYMGLYMASIISKREIPRWKSVRLNVILFGPLRHWSKHCLYCHQSKKTNIYGAVLRALDNPA